MTLDLNLGYMQLKEKNTSTVEFNSGDKQMYTVH